MTKPRSWLSLAGSLRLIRFYLHACCRRYRQIDTRILEPKGDSLAIRMFVRLIVSYQNEQLTANEWNAILSLESNEGLIVQSEKWDLQAINADIRLTKEVCESKMAEEELQGLYWRVSMKV